MLQWRALYRMMSLSYTSTTTQTELPRLAGTLRLVENLKAPQPDATRTRAADEQDVQIHIRPFREADAPRIRELFLLGILKDSGSSLSVALRNQASQLTSYLCYATFVMGLYTAVFSSYAWMGGAISLIVCAYFFMERRIISYAYTRHALNGLEEPDLLNIKDHYRLRPVPRMLGDGETEKGELEPSGPSCFWVAEARSKGEGEVVGFVGLDCYSHKDPSMAEARRLIVSSSYRQRGIGKRLLQTLNSYAEMHNVKCITLRTGFAEGPSLRLYNRNGWSVYDKVPLAQFGLFKVYAVGMRRYLAQR